SVNAHLESRGRAVGSLPRPSAPALVHARNTRAAQYRTKKGALRLERAKGGNGGTPAKNHAFCRPCGTCRGPQLRENLPTVPFPPIPPGFLRKFSPIRRNA